MKPALLFLAAALPLAVAAQNNDLSGTWREVSRISNNGNRLFLKDTIKLNFLIGNEYTWMKKGGFIYRGTYKVENGNLDLGMRSFTLLDMSNNRLVLRDDEATYEFRPYTEPARAQLPKEPAPLPVVAISQMRGDWEVYKRTSERTLTDLDYSTMIQRAMIDDIPDDNGDYGFLAAARDKDGTRRQWSISRYENGRLYVKGPSYREFEVLKAEKELILKEGDITYFFKQFD